MMDKEAKSLRRELSSLQVLKTIEAQEQPKPGTSRKSSESSEASRKKGNVLYAKQHHTAQEHLEILQLYSKSIALAPTGSEDLARAYGNRSALNLHLGRYAECVQDVDRALGITGSEDLRQRLGKRRRVAVEKSSSSPQLLQMTGRSNDSSPKQDAHGSVQIRRNDRHGRFLVAKRDIRPGEVIFAEQPYVSGFNTQNLYSHCGHCLTMTWSAIPCEHCGWLVYCSEKCKQEAWAQYHDVECFCIFYILFFTSYAKEKAGQNVCFDGLCVRALLKGLREAGSLEQLKEQLRSVDGCADRRARGFSENGRFESNKFISLYSLSSYVSEHEMKAHGAFAAITLTCIAKYTKFFGDAFAPSFSVAELLKNPDALFIGSLILRLSKISNVNSHCVLNVTSQCKYSRDTATCRQNWCCVRGTCILPIASLTNNSCDPNARRCFTNCQTFILYAVQPIKANTQICDSYYCSYYEGENPLRQNVLRENFNFECDCTACKKNWPCYPVFRISSKEFLQRFKLRPKELAVWNDYKSLVESVENKSAQFDQSLVDNISKAIEKSSSLSQPSAVNCKLIYSLVQAFEILYGYETQLCNNKC